MASNQLPLVPVVNKGLSYINGLEMTYATTTTFTVAQGQARNSTNVNDIILARPPLNNGTAVTTPFTVDITTNGAGGLDQGTIAASTLYYVFVISSSQNSWINLPPSELQSLSVPPFTTPSPTSPVVQDANYVQANVLISTSRTAPLLPFGFDQFRRIGCIRTTAGSVIAPFTQTGKGTDRTMHYQVPVAPGTPATGGSVTYATIGALLNIVPQVVCDVLLTSSMDSNTAGNVLYTAPYGNVAIASSGYQFAFSSSVTTAPQIMSYSCPCAFNGATPSVVEVDYATTEAADAVTFLVRGYVDPL